MKKEAVAKKVLQSGKNYNNSKLVIDNLKLNLL